MPSPKLGVGNEAPRVHHTGRNYRIPARLCRPGAGHSKIPRNCQLKGRQPLKSKGTTPLVGGWNSTRKPSGGSASNPRRQLASVSRKSARGWSHGLNLSISAAISSSVAFFGGHQFLGKAAPKITLRCFHQPGHQIFRHSVDRSILIDFDGVPEDLVAGLMETAERD